MSDRLSVSDWHRQFVRQARWTRDWRFRLYRRVGLWQARQVLDVGCGTGVITDEIARHTRGKVVGLDVDPEMVVWAETSVERVEWRVGDAHDLPFADGEFDLAVCNLLLMWVRDPGRVVREMRRVVKDAGLVVDTAEPDYGARIDHPEGLPPTELLVRSLQEAGADPHLGRRLRALFGGAGLITEIGVIPALWDLEQMAAESEDEWDFTEKTLAGVAESEVLRQHKEQERKALDAGERLVFMPYFYAVGRK